MEFDDLSETHKIRVFDLLEEAMEEGADPIDIIRMGLERFRSNKKAPTSKRAIGDDFIPTPGEISMPSTLPNLDVVRGKAEAESKTQVMEGSPILKIPSKDLSKQEEKSDPKVETEAKISTAPTATTISTPVEKEEIVSTTVSPLPITTPTTKISPMDTWPETSDSSSTTSTSSTTTASPDENAEGQTNDSSNPQVSSTTTTTTAAPSFSSDDMLNSNESPSNNDNDNENHNHHQAQEGAESHKFDDVRSEHHDDREINELQNHNDFEHDRQEQAPEPHDHQEELRSGPIDDEHESHEQQVTPSSTDEPLHDDNRKEIKDDNSDANPKDQNFEKTFVDKSDPKNPRRVHITIKKKSHRSPNESSKEKFESRTEQSLGDGPNRRHKQHTSSYSSSYSSGNGGSTYTSNSINGANVNNYQSGGSGPKTWTYTSNSVDPYSNQKYTSMPPMPMMPPMPPMPRMPPMPQMPRMPPMPPMPHMPQMAFMPYAYPMNMPPLYGSNLAVPMGYAGAYPGPAVYPNKNNLYKPNGQVKSKRDTKRATKRQKRVREAESATNQI